MVPIPGPIWRGKVAKGMQDNVTRLAFMSEEHHLVRDFAVRELPRFGEPLLPELIAQALGLPLARVVAVLDDLGGEWRFCSATSRERSPGPIRSRLIEHHTTLPSVPVSRCMPPEPSTRLRRPSCKGNCGESPYPSSSRQRAPTVASHSIWNLTAS